MNKWHKIIVLFIVIIYFSPGIIYSQKERYKFRHLTTNDGLPSNNVSSIIKDSKGFMWFGTTNGLARYDGYNIKKYPFPTDSLSAKKSQTVKAVFEDLYGNLWVGTSQNGLQLLDRVSETFSGFVHHPDKNPSSLSHNSVNTIFQDSDSALWIGTKNGLNKFDYKNRSFTAYKQYSERPGSPIDNITTIFEDKSGNFWIGTMDGLYLFDRKKKVFDMFDFRMDIPAGKYRRISSIVEHKNGILWIGTHWGVFKYNKNNNQVKNYLPRNVHQSLNRSQHPNTFLSNLFVMSIIETERSDDQFIWIATRWGLNKFDTKNEKFETIYASPDFPESISTNSLWGQYLDDAGQLWIATSDAGINILNTMPESFHQVLIKPPGTKFNFSAACFLVDHEKTIWIGAIDGGVFEYNRDFKLIARHKKWEFSPDKPQNNRIDIIYEDTDKNIWLGFYEWGLVFFDREKKTFRQIELLNKFGASKPETVDNIIQDKHSILWIGTNAGLYIKNLKEGITSPAKIINHQDLYMADIKRLFIDSEFNLWISTKNNGLYLLKVEDRDSLDFHNYLNDHHNSDGFSGNYIYSIYEDQKGTLWFGSDIGLNKFNSSQRKFESEGEFNSRLPGKILQIYGDDNNNLWIFHATKGLIRYQPYSDDMNNVKIFDNGDGLPFDKFNTYFSYINSFYQSNDGRLFMSSGIGTGESFFWFLPDGIIDNKHKPEVVITSFNIANESFLTDTNINFKREISLKYNQNFFTFEFAALDFIVPEKNQYAYFLEGFEDDWIYSGIRRTANYTGVPPGNYTFKVKGSNNDGYWNEEGTYITVYISPPYWKTWWAYLVYVLTSITIIYLILIYFLRRQRLLHKLALGQAESEKLKELDNLKTKFFTNISHEFRTPLTLILGPIQQLLDKVKNQKDKNVLTIAIQNTRKLTDLVNQLLSISKLESGKMKLQVTELNIVKLAKEYSQSFESLAKQNKIEYSFTSEEKIINIFIDRGKFERILFNLLSNAFKFTDRYGKIKLKVIRQLHYVKISISDTGCGIPPGKLKSIFNRFYQVDDSASREQEGTGIGLSIVSEMINLHHGKIEVNSKLGKGTTFLLFFPLGKEYIQADEYIDTGNSDVSDFQSLISPQRIDKIDKDDDKLTNDIGLESKPLLLIVEDNADMRTYIRGYFEKSFKIIEAKNGKEGIKKAGKYIPDIVISDIMMPKMDGYEFCKKLKTDEKTSHIPIILLTARASKESRLEGLETGADDFITKPFDGEELQVRVKNLIVQRKMLREFYRKDLEVIPDNRIEKILSVDDRFLQKAKEVVRTNLTNPEYKTENFASDMALSRFQLHRKLSALINQSATEFIRTIRLNYAMELLKSRAGTVSEIAYDAGFNNPTYFSISFKKHFGISPRDCLNTINNGHKS